MIRKRISILESNHYVALVAWLISFVINQRAFFVPVHIFHIYETKIASIMMISWNIPCYRHPEWRHFRLKGLHYRGDSTQVSNTLCDTHSLLGCSRFISNKVDQFLSHNHLYFFLAFLGEMYHICRKNDGDNEYKCCID